MQLLTFTVGGQAYAIESTKVVEVLPLVKTRPIPHLPEYLPGIFTYRGRFVPLVDLGLRINGRPLALRLSTRVIVAEIDRDATAAAPQKSRLVRFGILAENVPFVPLRRQPAKLRRKNSPQTPIWADFCSWTARPCKCSCPSSFFLMISWQASSRTFQMTPKRTIDSPQPGPERARGIEASTEMVGRKGLDAILSRWIGLDATTLGSASLTRAYQRRLEASGLQDLQSLQTLVECDSRERDLLVEEVVVSESWFFRDEQTFSFLEAFVRLILDTGRRRPVRILSIPCACGEEPYSIAMRLLDAGIRPDAFCIDAFDVSRTCLKRAALGHYSANAFRNADQSFRRRWFREEGSHSVIDPVIRSQVQFAWGNLLDRDFAVGHAPYDVIFCRNLLIYLTADARRHVAESLDRLLAADGALVLGAAEPPILGGRWMPTGSSSMFALRRRSPTEHESGGVLCTAEPADLPQRLPSPVQKPSARPPLRQGSALPPRSSRKLRGCWRELMKSPTPVATVRRSGCAKNMLETRDRHQRSFTCLAVFIRPPGILIAQKAVFTRRFTLTRSTKRLH